MMKLVSPRMKLAPEVLALFSRPPHESEIYLGGQYKSQIELDIHRTNAADDYGFFLNTKKIDLSGVVPKVQGKNEISFENGKECFHKQFIGSNISLEHAEKFSLMMTHLCNQGFNATPFGIFLNNYLHPLEAQDIITHFDNRKISLITEESSAQYLNYEWQLDLRNMANSNIICSRTLSYKFFPDNNMQISMDNPHDEYQDLFEDFFIKLNSVDKTKDLLDECTNETKNIISNVLSSDFGFGKNKEAVRAKLKIDDILESAKGQLKKDLERKNWGLRYENKIYFNNSKEVGVNKEIDIRVEEVSRILQKHGIDGDYLPKLMCCLSSQDCGNNIYEFLLKGGFTYRSTVNDPQNQEPNITLHIGDDQKAHVEFSLIFQKYHKNAQTPSENAIKLQWLFDSEGNVKLNMSGKKSIDYYKLYEYLHTTEPYDSKNTGDSLLRQNSPIALKKLETAKSINELLTNNYRSTTIAKLIDQDIKARLIDKGIKDECGFGNKILSDDIYNLLGGDAQAKLNEIAAELKKRQQSHEIILTIKDCIDYVINFLATFVGWGVTTKQFQKFDELILRDADDNQEYDNRFTKQLRDTRANKAKENNNLKIN